MVAVVEGQGRLWQGRVRRGPRGDSGGDEDGVDGGGDGGGGDDGGDGVG